MSDLCLNLSWHLLLCGSGSGSDSSPAEKKRTVSLWRKSKRCDDEETDEAQDVTHVGVVEVDAPVASGSGGNEAVP